MYWVCQLLSVDWFSCFNINQFMSTNDYNQPEFRRLWAYAIDPSLSLNIDTEKINRLSYKVKWENLDIGPSGEYIEIVDYDPTVNKYYTPVDLNEGHILAEDGIKPSISNPQFHQQMVYAVTMTTIQNFERALGRKILWSPRRVEDQNVYEEYVQKLRIYPHAFRDANAYYSPSRKAILFGYFQSTPANKILHMPNSMVFTCLSHDIIAHEVTHAILDGIHGQYGIPTNPDMLAFHEAFSDIVALFQHFTFPEVLKFEIARTQGNLGSENLLAKLAVELGSAIGGYGSLRDAIGKLDKDTDEWVEKKPDPTEYEKTMEPHHRGSILVAAVFDAFITIYKNRVKDLLRIASNGTGHLPKGALHPDLVNRLASEASKSAKHVLGMCIRALDYCPPVDLNFGDFLRAVITADVDLMKDDSRDYRLAFVEAFRNRGIYPMDIKALSIETLRYKDLRIQLDSDKPLEDKLPKDSELQTFTTSINGSLSESDRKLTIELINFLKDFAKEIQYINYRKDIFETTKKFITTNSSRRNKQGLHKRIREFSDSGLFFRLTGLAFAKEHLHMGFNKSWDGHPSFAIKNLRKVSRVGPDGSLMNHVVFNLLQKCGIQFNEQESFAFFEPKEGKDLKDNQIIFLGGCTIIFDLDNKVLKYVVSKPILQNKSGKIRIHDRFMDQFNYQVKEMAMHIGESRRYFGERPHEFAFSEPFAFLHHH